MDRTLKTFINNPTVGVHEIDVLLAPQELSTDCGDDVRVQLYPESLGVLGWVRCGDLFAKQQQVIQEGQTPMVESNSGWIYVITVHPRGHDGFKAIHLGSLFYNDFELAQRQAQNSVAVSYQDMHLGKPLLQKWRQKQDEKTTWWECNPEHLSLTWRIFPLALIQ